MLHKFSKNVFALKMKLFIRVFCCSPRSAFIGLLIYLRLNLVTLLLHLSWSGYSSHSLSRALLLSYINPEAKEESPDLRSNLLTPPRLHLSTDITGYNIKVI